MTIRPPPPTSIAIPGMTWSFDLPDRLKIAIADAIAIFSRIDHAVIECIWVLEQADLKRKKQISKEHAHENIKFVRGVVEEHMKLDIGPTWDALDEMRRERNLIAHGVWTMRFGGDSQGEMATPPEGLPMVLWQDAGERRLRHCRILPLLAVRQVHGSRPRAAEYVSAVQDDGRERDRGRKT